MGEAGPEDVLDEEGRNGEPEEELGRLPRGHAQRAALIAGAAVLSAAPDDPEKASSSAADAADSVERNGPAMPR